jgi:hypothetical protein
VVQQVHREIHYWNSDTTEPPCGTLEDRFQWSDVVEDVTCEECLASIAGDSGDLRAGGDEEQLRDADQPSP